MTEDVGKDKSDKERIAARLKKARLEKGYETASAFARAMDIDSIQTYINQENGSRGLTTDVLLKYCRKLEINLNWILYGMGPMWQHQSAMRESGPPWD